MSPDENQSSESEIIRSNKLAKRLEELEQISEKYKKLINDQTEVAKKKQKQLKEMQYSDEELYEMGVKVQYLDDSSTYKDNIYSLDNIIYAILQPLGLYNPKYGGLMYSKNKREGIYSGFDYYRIGTKDEEKPVYNGSKRFQIVTPFAVNTEKSELYKLIIYLKELFPVEYQAKFYFDRVYTSSIETEIKHWKEILEEKQNILKKFASSYKKLLLKAATKLTPHENNIVKYYKLLEDEYNDLEAEIKPYLDDLAAMQRLYERDPIQWQQEYLARLDAEENAIFDEIELVLLSMRSAKAGYKRLQEDKTSAKDQVEVLAYSEEEKELKEAYDTAQRNAKDITGKLEIIETARKEVMESVQKKANSPTIKVRTPYNPEINVGKYWNLLDPKVLKNGEFESILKEILAGV